MDKDECLDKPCENGGHCINKDPRLRYRCICPDGFWGENCELVQEGQTLKLSMGALAAILVCLLIILSKPFHGLLLFISFVCSMTTVYIPCFYFYFSVFSALISCSFVTQ